jgi:hypothetical protein
MVPESRAPIPALPNSSPCPWNWDFHRMVERIKLFTTCKILRMMLGSFKHPKVKMYYKIHIV